MICLWKAETPVMDIDTPPAQSEKFTQWRHFDNKTYFRDQIQINPSTFDLWQAQEQQAMEALQIKNYDNQQTIRLELVFHFLHSSDTTTILKELAYQLEVLNRDFSQLQIPEKDVRDPDGAFRALADNPNIEFVLSATEKEKEALLGVGSIRKSDEPWDCFDLMKDAAGGSPPVDPDRVINIWVVELTKHISSYASLPYTAQELDGIVLDHTYFGQGLQKEYNRGKTLTHLIGNYLGLYDMWGIDQCADDGVEDTPIHNSPTWGETGHNYISTCGSYPQAMTMNFMDNSPDAFLYMFTRGQVQRLRYMLSPDGPRNHLVPK